MSKMIKMIILTVAGMFLLTGFVTSTMASTNILVESYHPYANNFNYIWPEISQPEATQMRLHFTKLELDFDDKLTFFDKDGNKLVTFKDYNKEDFWTEWYTGNTIKLKLETNGYDTAYGFKIDQVETRNDMAPSGELPESYHPYANNFNYIWPEISQPEATQMRLHFTKLELDFDDKLTFFDKGGNKLVTFKDYNKEDFWTEWYTGNTIKLKLETNGYDAAYGFKIDQVETRPNPELIPIDKNETSSSSSAPFVYITNDDSDNISIIDTATNIVTATVSVGDSPFGVAVNPDGKKVYVANSGSNNVSVIDTTTNNVTATINVGKSPKGIAVSPDGTKIYVVNSENGNVSVIDTATNNVTATVNVGSVPYGVAVTPDGKKVYVTGGDLGNDNSNVSIIDTVTNNVIAVVNVEGIPYGIAVNPDGKKVYVASLGSNNVSVIDVATNRITSEVKIGNPTGVAVNPDGKKVYVANSDSNNVSVIDTTTNTVIATVPVGNNPFGVAVTPDGKKVYVANSGSNNVSVIDTTTNTVIATVPVGNNPRAFGQFIGGPVTSIDSTTIAGPGCKEIKDYLPIYTNSVNLNLINKVGNNILVEWTKAGSKEPIFKANVLNEQTRTVSAPTGSFDEYIRVSYPRGGCSWYRETQTTKGYTQLESGHEYTVTYYWGSNGTGLTPIPDSEAPE
ncbi:beta-propeller fold lactonase family protein [Methanosarcina sp. 1.H.T.1A.1]|uniref:YVTN family beta-propeller repeat protein n=1 Tax=Methanosarcina sp. 1.H.T.1A.1 TaxID=1483602 RepID=UPI000AF371F6|nr:beta-propeller fold lactonase family protein [Methanosarcina sp. 1.H.T.1A.1]